MTIKKDAYSKKVCHMPTRHVKGKKKRRIKKDSPQFKRNKGERDGSWKGVHTPSTQKEKNIYHHTLAHLDQGLWPISFGSRLWLSNTSKASMPLYSYPKLHISLIKWKEKRRQQHCLSEDPKQKEWFERIICGARLFFPFKNKNPSF